MRRRITHVVNSSPRAAEWVIVCLFGGTFGLMAHEVVAFDDATTAQRLGIIGVSSVGATILTKLVVRWLR